MRSDELTVNGVRLRERLEADSERRKLAGPALRQSAVIRKGFGRDLMRAQRVVDLERPHRGGVCADCGAGRDRWREDRL